MLSRVGDEKLTRFGPDVFTVCGCKIRLLNRKASTDSWACFGRFYCWFALVLAGDSGNRKIVVNE